MDDNSEVSARKNEPRELVPMTLNAPEAFAQKDFKFRVRPADEVDEVEEEVEADPKDSSAPESVASSTEVIEGLEKLLASSPEPEKTASAEKDSGKPKVPEAGVQTSSPTK